MDRTIMKRIVVFLVALLAFQLLPFVLCKRLYNAYKYQNYPRN